MSSERGKLALIGAVTFCAALAVFLNILKLPAPAVAAASRSANLEREVLTPPLAPDHYAVSYMEKDVGQAHHVMALGGAMRQYDAYVPAGGPERMPAIVLLHGAQRTGASMIEQWKKLADREKVILFAPYGLNGGWDSDDIESFIPAVVKDAAERYAFDPQRLYLFGHSAGGNLTLYAVYAAPAYSRVFAAAGVHAGSLPSGAALKGEGRKAPVIFINGDNDRLFPLPEVERSAQVFADSGYPAKLVVLKGHTHWYYTISDYINDLAWDYLSQYKLEP